MVLNKQQRLALFKLYKDSPYATEPGGYTTLRRTVHPLMGEPKVAMVPFCGMVVGIEPDGYTHS